MLALVAVVGIWIDFPLLILEGKYSYLSDLFSVHVLGLQAKDLLVERM